MQLSHDFWLEILNLKKSDYDFLFKKYEPLFKIKLARHPYANVELHPEINNFFSKYEKIQYNLLKVGHEYIKPKLLSSKNLIVIGEEGNSLIMVKKKENKFFSAYFFNISELVGEITPYHWFIASVLYERYPDVKSIVEIKEAIQNELNSKIL